MEKRNRKKCAGIIAMIFLIMSLGACGRKSSSMEAVFNDETRGYDVAAENAEETVCTGRITVSGDECLAVSSDLEKGCIIISAFPVEDFEGVSEDGFAEVLSEMSEDDEEKAALSETISGNNVEVYPLGPGTYFIAFITEKESTSGTLKAMPFNVEELQEQNKQLADTLGKEPPAADDASSDTAGTAVSSDAADTAVSSDAAGKDASADASDKDASSDAAGKDAASDAAGKDASADASDKDASSDAADTAASADVDDTAAASDDSGSEIAVAIEDSAKDAESAGEEDGQNPVMGFIGPYAYGRAGMYIEADGMHNARVSVAWGSSALEHSEWTMSGPFDEETLTITYSDCVRKDIVFNEDGSVKSETIAYENGTGTITFRDNGDLSLVWKDDQDHMADNGVFTWSFVPPEE